MKQDGYQVTSDIIAKIQADTNNTMRLTSDMDNTQSISDKDMSKINSKVKTPDNKVEKIKDLEKEITGK
jgi:hypothetical protein